MDNNIIKHILQDENYVASLLKYRYLYAYGTLKVILHMNACLYSYCVNSVGRWTDFTNMLHAVFHHCVFMLQVCEVKITNMCKVMQLCSDTCNTRITSYWFYM